MSMTAFHCGLFQQSRLEYQKVRVASLMKQPISHCFKLKQDQAFTKPGQDRLRAGSHCGLGTSLEAGMKEYLGRNWNGVR